MCSLSPFVATVLFDREDGNWLTDCECALPFKWVSGCLTPILAALLTPVMVPDARILILVSVGVCDDGASSSSSESDSKSDSEVVLEADPELNDIVSDKTKAGDREVEGFTDAVSNVEERRGRAADAAVPSFSILMLRILGSIGTPEGCASILFFI